MCHCYDGIGRCEESGDLAGYRGSQEALDCAGIDSGMAMFGLTWSHSMECIERSDKL